MKLRLLLFLILFITTAGYCQVSTNYHKKDLKALGLKGPVKYVVVEMFGNKSVRLYSRSGKLLKTTFYNSKGEMSGSETLEYDDNGRLVEDVLVRNNGFEVTEKYQYFNEGKKVERKSNRKNHGVKDSDEATFYFDDNGRLVKSTALYHRRYGDSKEKYELEYDANGNCVVVNFNHRGTKYRTDYTYNKHGKIIKELSYKEGKLSETRLFKYNEKGDEIESSTDYVVSKRERRLMSSSPTKYVYKYSYVYDDHGNWIKRTEERNGQKRPESSRLIEYY